MTTATVLPLSTDEDRARARVRAWLSDGIAAGDIAGALTLTYVKVRRIAYANAPIPASLAKQILQIEPMQSAAPRGPRPGPGPRSTPDEAARARAQINELYSELGAWTKVGARLGISDMAARNVGMGLNAASRALAKRLARSAAGATPEPPRAAAAPRRLIIAIAPSCDADVLFVCRALRGVAAADICLPGVVVMALAHDADVESLTAALRSFRDITALEPYALPDLSAARSSAP